MIVTLDENYNIVETLEDNVYRGSNLYNTISLKIPSSQINQFPTASFCRADGKIFGPLAHTDVTVTDSYKVYQWDLSKQLLMVAGPLQITFTINFTVDNNVVRQKNVAMIIVNILQAIVNNENVIIVNDDGSIDNLEVQIEQLNLANSNNQVEIGKIKYAYIKNIDYNHNMFKISITKQDDTILDIDLPFKYLKILFDDTTYTEITNDGSKYKIYAENSSGSSYTENNASEIKRFLTVGDNVLTEILKYNQYLLTVDSPNHGSDDVNYTSILKILNNAIELSSTNGVNKAVFKIDGETGIITYNGKEIGSQKDIDDLKIDVDENTKVRHTHSNKGVLDQIKNLGGANGIATLDSQGRLVQPGVKAEQDGAGNVINLYYQGKTLSVPIGKYMTVEECLNGLKQEIEVLIGGTITQEDLDTLKEISEAVFKAQSDIKALQDAINEIIAKNIPVASPDTLGVVKIGNNINVTEDGTISIDLSGYALKSELPTKTSQLTNDSNYIKNEPNAFSYENLSGKPDIPSNTSDLVNDSNFVASDNLKTINGQSIVGSGDIPIEGGGSGLKIKQIDLTEEQINELNTSKTLQIIENLDNIDLVKLKVYDEKYLYLYSQLDNSIPIAKIIAFYGFDNTDNILQLYKIYYYFFEGQRLAKIKKIDFKANENYYGMVKARTANYDLYNIPVVMDKTGFLYTRIIKATSNQLGGIKANTKTDEDTQEVHVDTNGFLWTKAGGGTSIEFATEEEIRGLFDATSTYNIINNASTYANVTVNGASGKTSFKKGDVVVVNWNDSEGTHSPKINNTAYYDTTTISIVDTDITIDSRMPARNSSIVITINTKEA